jgi:hypothetical protein
LGIIWIIFTRNDCKFTFDWSHVSLYINDKLFVIHVSCSDFIKNPT